VFFAAAAFGKASAYLKYACASVNNKGNKTSPARYVLQSFLRKILKFRCRVKTFHVSRRLVFLLPLLVSLLHALGLVRIPLLETLDDIYYDWRLVKTMPQTRDERIVIVDIDEKSMAEIGRWPWSRNKLAQLTRELTDRQQARVVGFDVVFAESDTSSGYELLQALTGPRGALPDPRLAQLIRQQGEALDYDALFAKALRGKNVVLGYGWTNDRGAFKSGKLPQAVLSDEQIKTHFTSSNPKAHGSNLTNWSGYGSNYALLADAVAMQGHFTPYVDIEDGVVRRVPLIAEYEGKGYEAFSLAVFRMVLGMPRIEPIGGEQNNWAPKSRGVHGLKLVQNTSSASSNTQSALTIPVDASARALIPFRGTPGPQGNSFTYVSASDVFNGKLAAGSLAGKVVLVGITALGLVDARITPVSKTHPGVEVHAHLLSGLLDGTIATSPSYAMGYEVSLLLLVAVVLALVLPKLSASVSVLFTLLSLAGLVVFNWLAYTKAALVLPLSTALLLAATLYFVHLTYAYFIESRAKRQITQLFGTYVPPELVDEMARNPGQYSLTAQSKEMTVMFCDIRDFTRLSETMSPTQLSELINQVFSAVTEVVQAYRGTLDKYLGDAVMAFWGAPVDAPNHAELAVQAALAIKPAIQALNKRNQSLNLPKISLGVGVNTGTMFVGDMGSKVRRAYTVVGDAVNLASRMEGLTRVYGVEVICGEKTRQLASTINWRELDTVKVKGKLESVILFEPLTLQRNVAEQKLSLDYSRMLSAYRHQNWDEALSLLQRLTPEMSTIKVLFSERIERFKATPPRPDWDGSIGFESK
jgi:adenylate cyclase